MEPMPDNRAEALAAALNVIALYLVLAVLAAAFYLQFARAQLPCPLCLLQRIAFTLIAAGLVFNLRFGPRARGYGLILLAAAVGGVTGVRQILLHIAPGDSGYGLPVFGLHDYTWATIIFAIAIVATAVVLVFDKALVVRYAPRPLGRAATIGIWLAIALTVAEAASALVECGFAECPDNPVSYQLLPPSL
jgi:disulfide bond formation protein DsbB